MNAVFGNFLPFVVADVGGKKSVKRNENVRILTGKLPCDLNFRIKILTEIKLILGRKQELLDHYDLCIRLGFDRFKHRAVVFLILLVVKPVTALGSVPCVVDADKN